MSRFLLLFISSPTHSFTREEEWITWPTLRTSVLLNNMPFLMGYLSRSPMQLLFSSVNYRNVFAISLRFECDVSYKFPKSLPNWYKLHGGNLCNIAATNRIKIAACLHFQLLLRAGVRQNLHWKVRQNLHKKSLAFTDRFLNAAKVNYWRRIFFWCVIP